MTDDDQEFFSFSNCDEDRRVRIRQLNDELRINGRGGTIVCTSGVLDLEPSTITMIGHEVRAFDRFDEDNDPHGEHDFGHLTVEGHKIMFKIDYYDESCVWGSPNPADPKVTTRIMTIMLSEEY